jgi:flagella basal body P-ring formation protein FlgA
MILIFYGLAPSFTVADETLQALETIQQQAHTFLLAQYLNRAEPPEIRFNPLDTRLRLPKCEKALDAFLPGGAQLTGTLSVGVRCSGARPWTVYQRATVRLFAKMLVASRYLAKGTTLSADDVKIERREVSMALGSYETAPENVIGKQLQGPLTAGMIIAPQRLRTIPPIRQGETVVLISRQSGMEIKSSGVALSDAQLGQRVRVRNEASKRVVEGTVLADHQVEVSR